MDLTLYQNHELKGKGYFLGLVGENKSEVLNITIKDNDLLDKWAYIEFRNNNEDKFSTPRLEIVNGVISYPIVSGLLSEGKVEVQVILRDETGFIWKSYARTFYVGEALCVSEDLPYENPDFITEAQKLLNDNEKARAEMLEAKTDLTERVEQCESTCKTIEEGEAQRVANETARSNNENNRKTNENTRSSNESKRVEAEGLRVEAENLRANNELLREEKENIRVENENARIQAEKERQEALNSKATIKQLESELLIRDKLLYNMYVANEGKTFENVEDNAVAYQKKNPNNVLPYAKINSVGGASYKSENLFNMAKIEAIEGENYSLTKIDNDTLKITINEEYNGNNFIALKNSKGSITLKELAPNLVIGKTYIISGNSQSNAFIYLALGAVYLNFGQPFTLTEENLNSAVCLYSNIIGDCVISNIQIEEGSEATDYEPYYEGFRNANVSSVRSVGKNLFNVSNVVNRESLIINNNDGTISVKDLSSSSCHTDGKPSTLKDLAPSLVVGKTYTISGNHTYSKGAKIYLGDNAKYSWLFGQSATITKEMLEARVYWYSDCSTETIDDISIISNIQIEEGTKATEYEPYKEYNLLIPSEIQALDGYGLGINETYHNYIDLKNKKYIQRVKKVVFDGSENWKFTSNYFFLMLEGSFEKRVGIVLPSILEYKYAYTDNYIFVGEGGVCYIGSGITAQYNNDVESWKTYLQELATNGTPLTLIVGLKTPIETDISEYLNDNLLQVEESGSITFENEYQLGAPSSITYQTKL